MNKDDYLHHYAAQLPVLGREGQLRLARSHVHVMATGRMGTALIQNLASVGIAFITANDPQFLEDENLGNVLFARASDIGQPKVDALKRFFMNRPNLIFEAIALPNENPEVDPYLRATDIIVSCANRIDARITADQKAIYYNKPIINAAVSDGREELTGFVWYRLPEYQWHACSGCLLQPSEPKRGEGLLHSVIAVTAAFASHIVLKLLLGGRDFLSAHNYHVISLEDYTIRSLAIQKRPGCEVCGARNGDKVRE